jgi:hypothetical protein
MDKSAWIEGVTDPRLNSSLLPLHAISFLEPTIKDAVIGTVGEIERLKVQQKATSDDGALVNLFWEKIQDQLFAVWNNPHFYLLQRREITEIDGKEVDISIPLTTRTVADELKWSAQHTRKVISSLNLAPKELPPFVKVGGKSYRMIYFVADKLEKRLKEFVVAYPPKALFDKAKVTEVTGVTLETYGEVEERTAQNNRDLRDSRDRKTAPVASYTQEAHEAVQAWLNKNTGPDGVVDRQGLTAKFSEMKVDPNRMIEQYVKNGWLYEPGDGSLRRSR